MGNSDDESTGRSEFPPPSAGLRLNCPYCGQKLVAVLADGPTAYYQCAKDGLLMLPSDGRLRKAAN